jgi:hypothetical protein
MTLTGTQNRPYLNQTLEVVAVLTFPDYRGSVTLRFDWNDRNEVRSFARQSDECIRAGGSTTLANA